MLASSQDCGQIEIMCMKAAAQVELELSHSWEGSRPHPHPKAICSELSITISNERAFMSQVGADSNSTGHGDMGTSFSEVGFGRCSHRLFIKVLRILYFPGSTRGEEPACQRRRHKTPSFGPWVGKVPWRRKRQPTPVFLPGDSHGQRSLAGYRRVAKSRTRLGNLARPLKLPFLSI